MEATIQAPQLPPMDEDGLLIHPEKWNEEVANELAHSLGIDELGEEHWLVIYALRDYYFKFGVAPSINHICHTHHKDDLWVHNLFESCFNAWRVAGLPDPGEEAKAYLSST